MIASRLLLAAGIVAACASSAWAQSGERRGYVEHIITDERHREPVYDVRSAPPRYYAPQQRSYRGYYGNSSMYVVPRSRERMYYNPYDRRVEPQNARLQVPREPAQQRRSIPARPAGSPAGPAPARRPCRDPADPGAR